VTRADTILALAERLRAIEDDAAKLGLTTSTGIHRLDRETFDQLPGKEDSFPSGGRLVYVKHHADISIYCDHPPVDGGELDRIEQEIARLQAHAQKLRGAS
jgi:hypothetical protein